MGGYNIKWNNVLFLLKMKIISICKCLYNYRNWSGNTKAKYYTNIHLVLNGSGQIRRDIFVN